MAALARLNRRSLRIEQRLTHMKEESQS